MEDDWRSSQPDMHEEVNAIILAHPRHHLDKILKMICGKMIASFVLLFRKQDVISFCDADGIIEINIQQIIDSFDVFRNEITVERLVRGRVLPCVARKSLLLLHIRFCYNLAVMLLVKSKQLLNDIISLQPAMRSRRSFDQLLNLSDNDEATQRELEALDLIEDLAALEPLERIAADQDPGLYLLETLERSGATKQHLLQEDEPLQPVELEEEPMFGMPAEFMWDTDAVINWLPEELRPSALFGQEQVRPVEPEQVNNGRGLAAAAAAPLPAPAEEAEPAARPRVQRPRRVQVADDALNRISTANHLENFLKKYLRKRTRERNLEYNNHLKMLKELMRDSDIEPLDTPTEKRPCPFQLEEVQDLVGQLADVNLPEFTIDDEHLLGVSNITLASNLSEGVGNIPLTPDVQGVGQQVDNVTLVAFQNLPPQPDTEMEPTFIEHMVLDDGNVLPENIADETLRIAPLPVEQTPQPAENAAAVDEPMQGIQQQPDNVEMMMQNLYQEPENAALAVSILIGETSFVHALPTHEVIEPEPVQPQDNIAGRLRPVRRRRLVFEDSPTSPPPRRRRRRRRQGARAADDVAAADGNAAAHDDLGVMQLPEIEPRQEPAEGFGRTFLDTPEDIRKNKFIEKLKELQIELGNLINFLQICPLESTLRAEAATVFGMLIALCHEKQIELIQDVPYAPDKLFIKINFGV